MINSVGDYKVGDVVICQSRSGLAIGKIKEFKTRTRVVVESVDQRGEDIVTKSFGKGEFFLKDLTRWNPFSDLVTRDMSTRHEFLAKCIQQGMRSMGLFAALFESGERKDIRVCLFGDRPVNTFDIKITFK